MVRHAVCSCHFLHPELGEVNLVVRSNAVRFTARWKGTVLQLTVPSGSSPQDVNDALESMKKRLLDRRPTTAGFCPGWRYDTPEKELRIERGTVDNRFTFRDEQDKFFINLPSNFERINQKSINQTVNKVLEMYATRMAPTVLLPLAESEAERIGVAPRAWKIGRGENRRGCCSAKGVISLSRNLVFFPTPLRRYVICHELAHLTHFDHSPAFHLLLDQYLSGHERELARLSNYHRLPFHR